jgi:membrane-bound metal-dependent hydrolase YbcI (DUF457 family)
MTTVAHTALGILGWHKFSDSKTLKSLLLFVIIASLPDIDFAFYLVLGKEGLGLHQLYTHNIFFVLLTSLLFWPVLKNHRERLGFMLVGFSHLALDFFTIDGAAPYGFRLFYPIWDQLFNFGILPNVWKANLVEVFSFHNVLVLSFEVAVFWTPLLLICRKQGCLSNLKRG